MFVARMDTKLEGLAQSYLRLLNAAVHRGLPSPHPGRFIAQGLLQILSATTPNLLWPFFGSCLRTVRRGLAPFEQVVAVALRNILPEFPATAAKTSILAKFIPHRLDLSGTEGISSTP
jgi:hypothetical protein